MAENLLFCSRCGTQNPVEASFCQRCGAGLGTNLPPAAAPGAPIVAYAPASSESYGGFWIRFVAFFADWVVLAIAGWAIRPIFYAIWHVPRYGIGHYYDWNPRYFLGLLPLWGLSVVGRWLYEALMTSSTWQATLGKRLLNLRVTDEAGNRISFARATGRVFAKYLSWFFCIGFIMAAFTDRKRALHDMLAGTLVRKG
jgi:uncharacterized RDD family membrane protein YckC